MTKKFVVQFISVLIFFSLNSIFSQQEVFKGDPDRAFEVARNLAFNKERKKAQDTLKLILTKYPNYHDIRSFLGSTYSWDGNYDNAREPFQYVVDRAPKRKDTWIAHINNELWAEKPYQAQELIKQALKHFPNDVDLLYKKASAQNNSDQLEYALITINSILEIDPKNEKAKAFKNDLVNRLSFNVVGLKSTISLYSDTFDPAEYYGFKYGRRTKYASFLAKVNYSRRFDTDGIQFEMDIYPKIMDGLYAYLNFGISNTALFPEYRYGAELYQSLPKSFEISAGFRALEYSGTTVIYTGSVGWYTGNSYWSFRPYFTPGGTGVSKSGTLNYRKYRADADNYFSISAGMGFSPEIYLFDYSSDNSTSIVELKSQKASCGYYFSSKNKRNAWGFQFGFIHQEKSFDPGNYYWMYNTSISWDLKLR